MNINEGITFIAFLDVSDTVGLVKIDSVRGKGLVAIGTRDNLFNRLHLKLRITDYELIRI